MRMGLSGNYKGQHLRSFAEYVYAVYLDTVVNVTFTTEPFYLYSLNNRDYLVEGKASQPEMDKLIVDYATSIYFGRYHKRPKYLNIAYTVSKNKIDSLFGNFDKFLEIIERKDL